MAMETKTFFSMLAFLLVVGTMASLMAGLSMPAAPNLDLAGIGNVCVPIPAPSDYFGAIGCFLSEAISVIVHALGFVVGLAAFFSGIAAIIGVGGSSISLPAPLNFIATVILIFAWVYLAIDPIIKFVGIIWGR